MNSELDVQSAREESVLTLEHFKTEAGQSPKAVYTKIKHDIKVGKGYIETYDNSTNTLTSMAKEEDHY